MKIISLEFVLLSLWTISVHATTPFLKEILQGRCYDRPPTGDVRDCPSVVDGFVAILESRLDAEITVDAFQSHLRSIDFSIPAGTTLLFLPFQDHDYSAPPQGNSEYDDFFAHQDDDFFAPQHFDHWHFWKSNLSSKNFAWVTPELTPGGGFLAGLVFCGNDIAENCSKEVSNAYWKYWEAIYGRFAACARGTLQVIVRQNANVNFIERSIVDNIDPDHISNVVVYADECKSFTAKALMSSLRAAGMDAEHVVCSDDPVEFALCAPDRESEVCFAYMNSCIQNPPSPDAPDAAAPVVNSHEERAAGVVPPPKTTDQEGGIQTEGHSHLVHSLMIVSLFIMASCIMCANRRDSPRATWWWGAPISDKLSGMINHSNDFSRSYRLPEDRTAQESSALLDEVTRNLFLDPNNTDDDSELQTVILQ